MCGSKNQEVEKRKASFTIIPNNSVEKVLLPLSLQPWEWCVGSPDTQRRIIVTKEHSHDSDEWKAKTTPAHLRVHMPLNQQEKKGARVPGGMIDPGY